ncbi:MAG: hypothetical protein KC503_01750 [Myxococcales bacterium]|nr:hypothetical protein [Myxococcales bacterium]
MRRERMSCIGAAAAAVLLAGCASAKPPPPPPPRPPAGPIVFVKIKRERPTYYELSFTPARSYEGLELHFELLDGNKQLIHADKMQIGHIFEGGRNSVVRGQRVVRRLSRPSDEIKVVGRRRSIRSHHDAPEINLAAVRAVRLRHVFSCRRERYRWRPGLPIPTGVTQVPRLGTAYMRNACASGYEADAPGVRGTFAFEARPSRTEGTLKLEVRFERDFPQGASFVLELLDARGQPVDERCTYHVQQPKVFEGTGIDYTIEMRGRHGVAMLERIRMVRQRDLRPHAGAAHELTLRRICR